MATLSTHEITIASERDALLLLEGFNDIKDLPTYIQNYDRLFQIIDILKSSRTPMELNPSFRMRISEANLVIRTNQSLDLLPVIIEEIQKYRTQNIPFLIPFNPVEARGPSMFDRFVQWVRGPLNSTRAPQLKVRQLVLELTQLKVRHWWSYPK